MGMRGPSDRGRHCYPQIGQGKHQAVGWHEKRATSQEPCKALREHRRLNMRGHSYDQPASISGAAFGAAHKKGVAALKARNPNFQPD